MQLIRRRFVRITQDLALVVALVALALSAADLTAKTTSEPPTSKPTANMIAASAIRADLSTLKNTLPAAHFDAFAYITPKQFDQAYQRIVTSLNKPEYTELEAYNLIHSFVSVINNGHTEVDFPIQAYISYATGGGTLFPLELAFEDDKALVRKNWSADPSIELGAEILSINGKLIKEVLSEIYPLVSAERPYFKLAKIEALSFPRYYWRAFGEQPEYLITLKTNARERTITLPPIEVMAGFEAVRDEVLNDRMEYRVIQGVDYLNPGSFSGDEAEYRTFIDTSFKSINARGGRQLIIDLRNNSGGNDSFSDYLVSYLADKPFRWHSRFFLKTSDALKAHTQANNDLSNPYFQSIMNHPSGAIYSYDLGDHDPQPEEMRYRGKVYVLVNRQSHSQAAVTAAQIQDYGLGAIVGEETGDYPSLYASQFAYILPETGITVRLSKGYIVRVSGDKAAKGVIPDVPIRDHLLDERDEIMETLLEKLASEQGSR